MLPYEISKTGLHLAQNRPDDLFHFGRDNLSCLDHFFMGGDGCAIKVGFVADP